MAISTRQSTATSQTQSKSSLSNDMTSHMMDFNPPLMSAPGAEGAAGKAFPVDESSADLAHFLDLSFTEQSAALPLPTATLFSSTTSTAPAQSSGAGYTNAFLSRHDDALLDSPLGLTASPFDFSSASSSLFTTPATEDFASPLLSGAFGTPELEPDLDYPSLFGDAPGHGAWAQHYSAAPVGPPASATLIPTELGGSVSPSLMSLDADLCLPPATATSATAGRPSRKRVSPSASLDYAEPSAAPAAVKDKFNGTRNTKIKPIDFDAPTLPKNYLLPSATSRKRAPAAIASKLLASASGGGTGKRQRRDSTPLLSPDVATTGELNADDLPDELLSAIELKRRQNTLAARRSRMRKAGHLAELQQTIDEKDQRIAQLEEELLALRRQLGA